MLRAVNVGGTAKLPMAGLREIATALGATEVQTYIQSGNLICVPPGSAGDNANSNSTNANSTAGHFDRALEQAIEERYGFFREAISRSRAELKAALDAHPFDVAEPKYSYITFQTEPPSDAAIEKARAYVTGDDVWEVIGRDLHIRYADGAGRPQMPAAKIGKALGVPGTARNLNTIRKLLALSGGSEPGVR